MLHRPHTTVIENFIGGNLEQEIISVSKTNSLERLERPPPIDETRTFQNPMRHSEKPAVVEFSAKGKSSCRLARSICEGQYVRTRSSHSGHIYSHVTDKNGINLLQNLQNERQQALNVENTNSRLSGVNHAVQDLTAAFDDLHQLSHLNGL